MFKVQLCALTYKRRFQRVANPFTTKQLSEGKAVSRKEKFSQANEAP